MIGHEGCLYLHETVDGRCCEGECWFLQVNISMVISLQERIASVQTNEHEGKDILHYMFT